MARLEKPVLLSIIVSAIQEGGWNVLYLNDEHPFQLQVYGDVESYRLRIYIWNITHGGKSRAESEYRVQVTGVDRFLPEPHGKTLILGWWDEIGVFAGWDFRYHQDVLGFSPSLQIRRETLEKAYQNRFSTHVKANNEVAVAFRPDFMVEYVSNLEELHGFGHAPQDLELLEAVAADPDAVNDSEIETASPERQVIIRSVRQRLRSSSFRDRVLTAYSHSCAFCGIQLELVQAAHIVPITHERGSDETHNGIAACYLHHAAYDRALIAFDEQYRVLLNEADIEELTQNNRAEGVDDFRAALRPLILIPPEISQRPHAELVQPANHIRGWT